MSRHGWAAAAMALGLGLGATAQAGVEFERVQITTVATGEEAFPGGPLLVGDDGQVVLVTASSDGAELFPIELGQGASAQITYAFEEKPVEPVSFAFGPQGGVLLRGLVDDQTPFGVTALLGLDGSVRWEQPDSAFSDDPDFIGVYQAPAGPVVWSPIAQRVLIFTQASFQVAPVSQGSMLFEFNGDVREASVLFGEEFIGASLNNALLTPDGKFLVYYFSQNDRGTRFFIYDGVQTIRFFEPEGGDWASRVVYRVEYDPNKNLTLLWSELSEEGDRTRARLTKLDPDGKLLWETDLSGSVLQDVIDPETMMPTTIQVDLLRPVFMVSAAEEVILLRQAGDGFFFDVRSAQDGAPLGFFDFFALTENAVFDLKFLKGSQREYILSTVNPEDPTANEVLQVRLALNDEPVVIGDGSNNGPVEGNNDPGDNNDGGPLVDPDDEPEDIPDVPDCGCVQPSAPTPRWPLGALTLGLVGLLGVARRRR